MEMLIVVVIIGILAAAILPRLTGAQAATRDVARQKGLTDISTALEMMLASNGSYPEEDANGSTANLNKALVEERGYLKDMPVDPQQGAKPVATKAKNGEKGKYSYRLLKKAGAEKASYALISVAETYDKANATDAMVKQFSNDTDSTTVKLCDSVVKSTAATKQQTEYAANSTTSLTKTNADGKCQVTDPAELRFVLIR